MAYALSILHNCSKAAANVAALRKAGAKDMLAKYCDPVAHDSSIAYSALLTLANIMVDFEVDHLEVHDNMLVTIVRFTGIAVAIAGDRCAEISFHPTKHVDIIGKLAKNAACRISLVKKNVIKHLVQLMEIGDQTEQQLACNAVWELLSEQTISEVVMTPKLTDVVEKLKGSGVSEVATAANRVLVKIRQVLNRSGGRSSHTHHFNYIHRLVISPTIML